MMAGVGPERELTVIIPYNVQVEISAMVGCVSARYRSYFLRAAKTKKSPIPEETNLKAHVRAMLPLN